MNKKTLTLAGIALLSLSLSSSGAVLADWNSFDAGSASYPRTADSVDANITSATLGINNLLGVSAPPGITQFSLWNAGASVDSAEYIELSLSVNSGFEADLSSLQLRAGQNDTALNLHIRSSADGFASDVGTVSLGALVFTTYSVDLSSLPNLTGNFSLRIYGTDAGMGESFFGENAGGPDGNGFIAVNGIAISAVPEPQVYTLAALGAAGLLLRRKWK